MNLQVMFTKIYDKINLHHKSNIVEICLALDIFNAMNTRIPLEWRYT